MNKYKGDKIMEYKTQIIINGVSYDFEIYQLDEGIISGLFN